MVLQFGERQTDYGESHTIVAEDMGSIATDKNPDTGIKAICNNCSKRFKSVCAITLHLNITGGRHSVNFIDHGSYNKNTGIRQMKTDKINKEYNDFI